MANTQYCKSHDNFTKKTILREAVYKNEDGRDLIATSSLLKLHDLQIDSHQNSAKKIMS